MLIRIFTLKFAPQLEGFDDRLLQEFVKDKDVLSLREYFFQRDAVPYLAVVVTYRLPSPVAAGSARAAPGEAAAAEKNEKWRQLLEEADWPLFNTLRDWRNDRARKEGVPPYVICTNRQLAEIAHRRPGSMSELAAIEGLGKTKLERYGKELLPFVGPPPATSPPPAAEAVPAPTTTAREEPVDAQRP